VNKLVGGGRGKGHLGFLSEK